SHVGAAGPLPAPPAKLAQGTERKRDQGSDSIDVPAPALRQKMSEPPAFRLESAGQDAIAQCSRQQNSIAGHEIPGRGEPTMGGDIVRPCHAVAIEEDAISSCAGAD